jgi:uncharacterized protein
MIVYKNLSKGFLEDVQSNKISRKIHDAVLSSFGWNKINDKEFSSWANSMQFMGNVIRGSGIADDCGVLIEYNLPSTSLRVDFIISGHDETGKSSFIIIELKQWKEAQSTGKDGIVTTKYYGECTHPAYQAYSYKLFLKDFNQNVYNSAIEAYSCAYLHNYEQKEPEPLKSKIYESVLKESPIYFQDDQIQLEEFIRIYVGKGKGEDILYQIERGNIRPSKKLIDLVSNLFQGNQSFTLLEEQKIAFENAKDLALNAKEKTVIINGGPGTGKSVISMNLLGALIKKKNTIFVAPNASFREVMLHKLTSDLSANRVKHLFKGSSAFYGARKNTFEVVIVDEAHRLKNEKAYMYKGKNQIEDIVKASKVSIFFIDEKQIIRPEDIGTFKAIERVAKENDAQIHSYNLKAQFRCSGAEGYINWIDDVLQLESTGNFDGWDKDAFEFRMFSNPNHLREAIRQKANEGLNARMLAGYAWEWTAADKGNSNGQIADVSIPEFDFNMPWNSRSVGSTWAIDEAGINQIGCVHTSQGLEFDYVGVIVGKDLQFDSETKTFFTTWDNYRDAKGKQGLKKDAAAMNKLVRNIYRILMTRGMKGCYVHFMDRNAEDYFARRVNPKTKVYPILGNDNLTMAAEP